MHALMYGSMLGGAVELGDPTFYLAILLTAWCPFKGLRSMRGASAQRGFLLLGFAGAISLHIVLVMKRMKPPLFDLISGATAVGMLVLFGVKALGELWTSPESEEQPRDVEVAASKDNARLTGKLTALSNNPNRSYGATSFMGQDRLHKGLLPIAFFTAMASTFAMLPDGRWDTFLFKGEPPALSFAIGSGLGFGVAMLGAVLFGSILQASAREQRMRFMITCSLWALVLWTGSGVFLKFHDDHLATKWRENERMAIGIVAREENSPMA